ncbi:heavy metal-associated isoprenylated plant protein 39-like [Macadamia integrifolia]|uniref:heavy metal-associated isoprenylated plant protein 39-like n=1 Tax=Macadamia integrifolia TaxID=60698 RepID=UPI001C4E717A|nr:heavy metal-associated isoprenylated plant protein 39-like [Macadamia integrifolia]
MQKVVLKVELCDAKAKRKAMKAVSTIPGIDSLAMDMEKRLMTVIGEMDPICIVGKLRKSWPCTQIVSVGPAKEPEKKKEETKKPEKKKEDPIPDIVKLGYYNPYPSYYVVETGTVPEENPSACCVVS